MEDQRKADAHPPVSEVDITLIRWMRSLTPAERLQYLEDSVDFVLRYRGAAQRKKQLPRDP